LPFSVSGIAVLKDIRSHRLSVGKDEGERGRGTNEIFPFCASWITSLSVTLRPICFSIILTTACRFVRKSFAEFVLARLFGLRVLHVGYFYDVTVGDQIAVRPEEKAGANRPMGNFHGEFAQGPLGLELDHQSPRQVSLRARAFRQASADRPEQR